MHFVHGFFNGSGKVTVVERRQPYPHRRISHRKHLKPQTEFRWNLVPSHEEMQNLNKNGVEMFRPQSNEPQVQAYPEFPG